MALSASVPQENGKRRSGSPIVLLCFLDILFLLLVLLLFSTSGYPQALTQDQQKESLGSLSSVGEVSVNDSAAPVESTIFSGDRVRTGETGTATFTVSGKGTLKILPRSDVVFPGNYQFMAELKNGTVVLHSITGPGEITLRVENYVLVTSFRQQTATTRIERTGNGSHLVSCLDGGVGVLTVDAKAGQFLQAGQSLNISAGQLKSSLPPETNPTGHIFHSSWLYLGLGGAAAAGAAAGFARGGGKQSISPSSP